MCKLGLITYWITLLFLNIDANQYFPNDFKFGISTSAYQIEGGHNVDGKGPNLWDYMLEQKPYLVEDQSNGNVACDSYHHLADDLESLDQLNVDFYRFSIAWSRILPEGYPTVINELGLEYYDQLIDGLLARGIEPVIVLSHYDLPMNMHEIGGWANPFVADYFLEYARIVLERYGGRVKKWISFNGSCKGYGKGTVMRLEQAGLVDLVCMKVMLMGHASVYHLYHDKMGFDGEFGFIIDGRWTEPFDGSQEDVAEFKRELDIGIILEPILGKSNDFPRIVRDRLAKTRRSRMNFLKLTDAERAYIKNSTDFIGLNYYSTVQVNQTYNLDHFTKDIYMGMTLSHPEEWGRTHLSWLRIVPWGLRKLLKWVKDKYNNPKIWITENGYSDEGGLDDQNRINFLKSHLDVVLTSINQDGVNVKRYAVWSLFDNFEWFQGYTSKFGLYHVDFSNPNRTRTPKSSVYWYKNLIRHRRTDAGSEHSSVEL